MGRLFGTDGVRGIANETLTCELALDIGRAAAYILTRRLEHRPAILIGRDTRISSDMLQNAIVAGICSVGASSISLGVAPTPSVALLVRKYGADAGIVISASHNPVEFNGIKIFNSEGYKLADAIEDEIESYIFEKKGEIKLKTHGEIGTAGRSPKALEDYVEHVVSCVEGDLEGIRAVIDCANGAAYKSAREIFARLKVDAHYIGVSPDGVNINDGVGSTHLEKLRGSVLERGADIGIAFDGDADRCLAVDERGSLIDGDMIIAALARYFKEQGRLKNDACVVTVMTNLGFMDFCKQNGIRAVRTAVGDRYVLEELLRSGCVLGGEQSGHVIMTDYCTTGDGEATAALLLQILKQSGKRASELFSEIKRYPQLMINLPVSAEGKARFKEDEELQGFIEAQQQELFDTGRVLVRVSGTEPLIRIMVEGRDEEKIKTAAREIEQRLKERLG